MKIISISQSVIIIVFKMYVKLLKCNVFKDQENTSIYMQRVPYFKKYLM